MEDSYQTLKRRWGDAEFLRRAAILREHLAYERIRFGKIDEEKRYVISLLPQAHESYYMGHWEASIAMCGSLLEAFLTKLIADRMCDKSLRQATLEDMQRRGLQRIESIQNLALNDLIKLVSRERSLNQHELSLLHNVKELRNRTLHGRIPLFEYQAPVYVCSLSYGPNSSREIEIPESEVVDIDEPPEQITAWYCLKYSRYILHRFLDP
ncbi:MAG: hypothetical protein AAF975_03235 [Spirochaetota bacterium]